MIPPTLRAFVLELRQQQPPTLQLPCRPLSPGTLQAQDKWTGPSIFLRRDETMSRTSSTSAVGSGEACQCSNSRFRTLTISIEHCSPLSGLDRLALDLLSDWSQSMPRCEERAGLRFWPNAHFVVAVAQQRFRWSVALSFRFISR